MGIRVKCVRFCWILAVCAGALAAQPVIDDVVNAAGRIPSGFPGYGVAQGSLFAVRGKGLGPDTLQQASFPLPAAGGLAGVTVKIEVGGASVDGIMAYVSSFEAGAILPSATPLGTGTVTLSYNGASVTAPITVVASAFGAFSFDYYSGVQNSAAFNEAADGALTLNYHLPGQTALPGQVVMLNGTGLGAISADETQSGPSGQPNAQIKVFVGTKEATVLSAGRGTFPGLPEGYPGFPVPAGIAAWDVIRFTVPEGIAGCRVPVAVQTGSIVSNFTWISIAPDGGECVDPNTAEFGEKVKLAGSARTGYVNLLRTTQRSSASGITTEIGTETGTANFFQFDVPNEVTVRVSDYAYSTLSNNLPPGACLVQTFRVVIPTGPIEPPPPIDPAPNQPKVLDAGPLINLKNSASAAQKLDRLRQGGYGGGIGSLFSMTGIPADTSKVFLIPGTVTADNGTGGADVPAFTASLTLPRPALTFDNIDAVPASLDRAAGVTVRWSGGDPASFVNITGLSMQQSDNVTLMGNFFCSERISAGEFTVPPFVTLTLPVTASKPPLPPIGVLAIWNYVVSRINIPSIDIALFSAVLETQKPIQYK